MADRESMPLVPVILTEKSPKVFEVTVRIDLVDPVSDGVMFVELNIAERPAVDVVKSVGDTDRARLTLPPNPCMLGNVKVVVAEDPASMLRLPRSGKIVKSGRKSLAPI